MSTAPRYTRPALVLLILLLAAGSAFVLLTRPFSQDILDLLPVEDQVIGEQYDFLSAMNAVGTIVVECATQDPDADFGQLASAARAVSSRLTADSLIVPGPSLSPADFLQLRTVLIRHWPNLFSPEDSALLAARMHPDSLSARLSETLAALFTISDRSVDAFSLRHDPFDFAPLVLRRLAAFRPSPRMTIRDGLVTDTSGTRVLFVLGVDGGGLEESTARAVESAMTDARALADSLGADLTWMSAHRAALDNSRTIRRDVNRTAPLTALLIMLLCVLVYRRFYYGVLVFVPTFLGIACAMAAAALLGTLSIIVLGFAATLIGITVDYAVHYFFHIENHPDDKRPARTLTPAILASSLTTAGAFVVLTRAGIPGLTQLSLVAAGGILLVALFSLTLLPALFRPAPSPRGKARLDLGGLLTRGYEAGLSRRLWIPLLIAATVLWLFVPKLQFEGDPDALNGMSNATRAAERHLQDNWPGIMGGTYCVVEGASPAEAIERTHDHLAPLVDSLAADGLIHDAATFTRILPPRAMQTANRRRWSAFFTPERREVVAQTIARIATQYGLPPARLLPYADDIAAVDSLPYLERAVLPDGFAEGVLRSYLCEGDGVWYGVVPVVAASDTAWKAIARRTRSAGAMPVNDDVLGDRVVEIVRGGFFGSLVYLPLVMLVVLAVILRSVRLLAAAVVPPLLATGLTLGGMALLGLPVTIVSFMVLAFVFGLGIDYAVFLVHMCRRGAGPPDAGRAAGSVTVAALTTVAGLGVTVLARHPVLVSLGATGLIGIVSSYLCAVVFVPLLLRGRGAAR
ncbi:MAG: MMPL family transporter [Chitinivibrionales bacterium]|nr:MMPL family transporter [Chitinivibrionales bacterium]